MSSPVLLEALDDFTGGHYGYRGGRIADAGTWGGVNMIVTRDGGIGPVSSSRPLRFENLSQGEIKGVFWAWGADEKVYYLQELTGDDVGSFQVRRFLPDPENPSIVIEDIGDPIDTCERLPDWAVFSGLVYLTIYNDFTYSIDPALTTLTKLTTALVGDVPGGRAICTYGERLMIGGINDGRFDGAHGNRVVFSEPADPANVPDTNLFDVGADNLEIAALYPTRDVLVIMFSDQTLWSFNGIPGFNDNLRRQTGFQKGTGGITAFTHDNGAVDPAQTRIWFYDHMSRSPARWNGAAMSRLAGFGVMSPDRTAFGRVEGAMAMIGAPDEFVMDRVTMPRTDSDRNVDSDLVMVRISGAVALVERSVLTGRN